MVTLSPFNNRIIKKLINVWFLLVFAYLFFKFRSQKVNITKAANTTAIIHSAIFYNKSKLYSDNTVIILFNAPISMDLSQKWLCISHNPTSSLITETNPRLGHDPSQKCLWNLFISNCTTVANPIYFSLSLPGYSVPAPITLEYAVYENYPVIMCYPPMVYEERWQQIIVAIETYKNFGANKQVQYVNSVNSQIMNLLKHYESQGTLDIIPFTFFDFDKQIVAEFQSNPIKNLIARNQPMGLTDCLVRYREAANYIIIADLDELLLPIHGDNYHTEFAHWSMLHPHATAFIYPRIGADITFSENFEDFSLQETLNSIKIYDYLVVKGKSVYQTKYAETAWVHWPGIGYDRAVDIPFNQSLLIHATPVTLSQKPQIYNFHKTQFHDLVSSKTIKNLSTTFHSKLPKKLQLQTFSIYNTLIFQCYFNYYFTNDQTCLTPLLCSMPKRIDGFQCKVAKRKYKKHKISGNLKLFVPEVRVTWKAYENGCEILTQNF